jgi:hypothetical protein
MIDCRGRHYGRVLEAERGYRLWLDGVLHPVWQEFVYERVFDTPATFMYRFSPGGERLAYVVREGQGMRVIVDDRPGELEEDVDRPTFSPDGRHFAYVALRRGLHYVVLDGVPGPGCGNICYSIVFSPNSQRIAYVARDGQETYVVVDQKPRRDWPEGAWLVFSPNSKRIGYMGKDFAVVDGVKGAQCSLGLGGGSRFFFSPDSRHFACTVGTRSFVDWRPLPLPNNGTGVWYTVFSPNLEHWACNVRTDGNDQVFLDGKPQTKCNGAFNLRFSSDNLHFAYEGQIGTNWWMVLDDKVEALIDLNWATPYFSPNGKRLAYIAGRGSESWVMADGHAGPKFIGTTRPAPLPRAGSEDIPGVTTPQFSSDSRHMVYAARQGARWGVLVDQTPVGGLYEKIVGDGPSFGTSGDVEFLGIRNGSLYRVSASRGGRD